MSSIQEILHFWFGDKASDTEVAKEKGTLWFRKSPETDQAIRQRFEETLQRASAGELESWKQTPQGVLALLLLFDQMSRNIYRDTRQAFAYDHLALRLALEGLAQGVDLQLRKIERVFFYLPFEHTELLEMQEISLDCFHTLLDDAPDPEKDLFSNYFDYAYRHHVIIQRFGRFPHRNVILQRPSTPEEEAFLKEPGSSF